MESPINDGGPAFQFGQVSERTGQPINGFFAPGMTLRDYFAAKALTAINWIDMEDYVYQTGGSSATEVRKFIADSAFAQADAMIAARDGKEGQ